MQRRGEKIVYSASDLMAFLECHHLSTLNLLALDTKMERAAPDEQIQLIQDKGFAHEADFLESLRQAGGKIVELSSKGELQSNIAATRAAMAAGAEVIFQAALSDGTFFGYADFLRRVDRPSAFGDWSYEVADTKLAHRAKPKFMIQLAHYSELLTSIQGVQPGKMHLVLGNRAERSFRVSDYIRYYRHLRLQFEVFIAERPKTQPESCAHCPVCDWRDRCADAWERVDHLNQVANISKIQIKRLAENSVHTLAQLAELPPETTIRKMQPETLARIRGQASLQLKRRLTGKNIVELLPRNPSQRTGFDRLPPPDIGDLFFDMEGDPLHEGGLEYLFGVYFCENGEWTFREFWAHTRLEEKAAFVAFIDFVTEHLKRHPNAHIYHYAHYEPTALKRLMSSHGVREAEVDQLLRSSKFVDLFQVVRDAIRVSEPSYSIKNLEVFYMTKREGDVTSAGASVVFYEKWRQTKDDDLLRKIRDYNKDDCISTQLLHQWLLQLRPDLPEWQPEVGAQDGQSEKSDKVKAHEMRLAAYEVRLLAGFSPDAPDLTADQHLRVLIFQLLDFYRRTAKPAWWALFARRDMTLDELVDDSECIAGMRLISTSLSATGRGAQIALYQYPEQEFKLREGDTCVRTDTTQTIGTIGVVDQIKRTVEIKVGKNREIPEEISVSSGGPIPTDKIRDAIFRLADELLSGGDRYAASFAFLKREAPRVKGHREGDPFVAKSTDPMPQIIRAVANLDQSCLFIQGPPGAGKTYTGSHLIVDLLARGHRIGVTSNSHKAIHNLLKAVEKRAGERGLRFKGLYKASAQSKGSNFEGEVIENVVNNQEIFEDLSAGQVQLVAGTAWLFSDEGLDQQLDYLFVDEAGQVATANLVAMGTSATNIVLLGDQMQLGQPIQGVHPGDSGLSSLDFLLEGRATIPPERGVFLETSWRMHPDVCQFISDAMYESRLRTEEQNAHQRLVLTDDADSALRPTGVTYLPVIHDACSQSSEEEATKIRSIYMNLLRQRYRDRDGNERDMTAENILVVAPYNIQVNLLRQYLPEDARVGTVDKFQGQEAEVAIISMTTSSGDYLPRFIEFLYSRNRLNVAISRARCLALVVMNPDLLSIRCSTVEEMALANSLCWVKEYSEGSMHMFEELVD
jgi:uncharacterized protein